VNYTDGSTGTLYARVVARITVSYLPSTVAENTSLPAFIEFDRPTKPVSSAYLTLTVTQHWGIAATIRMMLLDPPMNTEPVTNDAGLATLAAPLDA